MQKVLTIYTDGSYREYGGWAYVLYDDYNKRYPCVSYGACNAKTSTQAEAIACIRALDNYELFKNYESIEICTDQLHIVQIAESASRCRLLNKEFQWSEYRKCIEELQSIAYIQYQLGAKLKFKKIHGNRFLKPAHNHAKKALDLDPSSETYLFKAKLEYKPKKVQYKNRTGAGLMEQYKDVSDLIISTQVDGTTEVSSHINLRVCDIDLLSKTHLEAKHLKLSGVFAQVRNEEIPIKPITVRLLESGRYELISGLKSCCVAKIIDVEYIPCVIVSTYPLSDNNCA